MATPATAGLFDALLESWISAHYLVGIVSEVKRGKITYAQAKNMFLVLMQGWDATMTELSAEFLADLNILKNRVANDTITLEELGDIAHLVQAKLPGYSTKQEISTRLNGA